MRSAAKFEARRNPLPYNRLRSVPHLDQFTSQVRVHRRLEMVAWPHCCSTTRDCYFERARQTALMETQNELSVGAGEGNRTLVCSLGSCRSAIELRPRWADNIGAGRCRQACFARHCRGRDRVPTLLSACPPAYDPAAD